MNLVSILVVSIATALAPSAGQEGPKNSAPPAQSTSLAAERRELAEIQLLLGADRDYAQAKERLAKLAESLAGRKDAEAQELLGRVQELERKVRRALGEPVPDDRQALIDGKTGDKVDEAVVNALLNNDFSFIRQLGKRAAPGLAQAVRARPDEFPGEVAKDPLALLMECDPLAASQLVEELLDLDGFLWRRRLFRAFREADPLASESVWTPGEPKRCLADGLVHALEKYAADPDVGNQVLQRLDPFLLHGLTPTLRDALIAALRSPDQERRNIAWKEVWPIDALQSAFEEMFADSDADLRIRAADVVSNEALYGRADDPEVKVRAHVLSRLENTDRSNWQRAEHAVLAKLLADDDQDLRQRAWRLLADFPKESKATVLPAEQGFNDSPRFVREVYLAPLPDEVYRSLLRWPVAWNRSRLAEIALRLAPPLCLELCTALAGDSDVSVRTRVEELQPWLPTWSDPEAALRIVAVLRDDATIEHDPERLQAALRPLAETRVGLSALARWIVARNEVALQNLVKVRLLATIDGGPFADYVTWLFEHDPSVTGQLRGWNLAATRALAEDRSRPLVLRMSTLLFVCHDRDRWDEGLGATVEEILADSGWGALDQGKWSGLSTELHALVSDLPGEARNRAITVMLDNAALPEWLSERAISTFDARSAGAAAIGKRVIARWFGGEGQNNSAVREAIGAMAALPELRDDRVLAEATRRNGYTITAWDTIAWLKDPAFLPLIRAALEESGERKAAEALFGYLSDEAAELLLLAAAKVQNTDLRDRCLEHLEKIREYQDSRERWATRKVKTATREQVVAQLVEQLGAKSDDVKVQAIRALATWEAVEVMPKLIELTTSGSKSVAAAAREALERLNAPKKD